MDNTETNQKIERAFGVSKKMIADMEEKLQDAIWLKDWKRAAELQSNISGMSQILIVFELSYG